MVTITQNKIIIEIPTSLPQEFKEDIKQAIIHCIQYQQIDELSNLEAISQTNYCLMELLKHLD